jgi:hypothetical protein
VARYDHLQLVRLAERFERRKHGGAGPPPSRDLTTHATKLRTELDTAVEIQQRRRKPEFVDPSLILRVQMTDSPMEEEWERAGLTILSTDADRTLILFASTDEMREFRARLDAYQGGPTARQKHAPYYAFIGTIEAIGSVESRDRIGVRFREDGFVEASDFQPQNSYVVDIELWDFGIRSLREWRLDQIAKYGETRNGEVLDRYVGPSITMLRARVSGALLQTLLTVEDIASIDLPPQPDVTTGVALDLVLDEVPPLNSVPENAPVIGIIDSGVNAHPFLEDILVGAIGVPSTLGTADDWGHGTRVSGVAVFGDLRAQLHGATLNRGARLCSAKVVNDRGTFDERKLVPSQMRDAITTLNTRFGCRIFVVALGDDKRAYDGGKVGTWAATLDELVRELDVVIVVSLGNRNPRSGTRLPEPFRSEGSERTIRVTLAFDPPVRHTRADYAGVGMSFRLIRGCKPKLIFDHYRKRTKEEGPVPEIEKRFGCSLLPGPQAREKATVQSARVTFKRSIEAYGDTYYLVAREEFGSN